MSLLPHQEQETGLIPLKSEPLPTSPEQQSRRRIGFFRTVGAFLGLVKDYTADDIGRLVEAEVVRREGEARKPHAEAEANIALAAERHATAEQKRAEATATQQAVTKRDAEQRQAAIDDVNALADALERVEMAVTRIKIQGGAVLFNQLQLKVLLEQGESEFPDDKLIQKSLFPDDTGNHA